VTRNRESVTLPWPPDDPARLREFPTHSLSPDREIFRVALIGYGPWWFGSSMKGRFDLPEPDGTCYLAANDLAAWMEVIGPEAQDRIVSAELLRARRLVRVHVPRETVLSDSTARQAGGFSITLELSTIVPYDLPQAWAARLRAAGSAGIVYWLRHDNSRTEGFALFGPHGERTDWPWQDDEVKGISPSMILRLRQELRIEVEETPRLGQLRVITD
jgi:hypothetical protein